MLIEKEFTPGDTICLHSLGTFRAVILYGIMTDENTRVCFTPGQIIEMEIMQFMNNFVENQEERIAVLLFPFGLPPNLLKTIRYIAMLYNLFGIYIGEGRSKTIAVFRQHHLKELYRENIDTYFVYEDSDINLEHINNKLNDTLTTSFLKHRKLCFLPRIETVHRSFRLHNVYHVEPRCFCGHLCSCDTSRQAQPHVEDKQFYSKISAVTEQQITAVDTHYANNGVRYALMPKTAKSNLELLQNGLLNDSQGKLNPCAKEFIPCNTNYEEQKIDMREWSFKYFLNMPKEYGVQYFVDLWKGIVAFDPQCTKDICRYVGNNATVVLAGQDYQLLMNRMFNMDYIVELRVPSHYTRSYVRNIYNDAPSYLKWCDDTTVLLVTRSPDQANRMLKTRHKSITSRPFSEASPLSFVLAYYCNLTPAYIKYY